MLLPKSFSGIRSLFFVLILVSISIAATTSAKLVVAVGSFEANGVTVGDASILADRLRAELINTGAFRVMERSQMEDILKEQSFQQSGACTSSECQVQAGQLLGVDRMVAGVVGLLGGNVYTVSARMLDVQTGEVLFTVSQDYQGPIAGLLSEVIPTVARRLGSQVNGMGGADAQQPMRKMRIGDVFVESDPTGASVFLDQQPVAGKTPMTLQGISAGTHHIEARLGQESGDRMISLAPDDLLKISLSLKRRTGDLKIFSEPMGATVMIDGKAMGNTPLKLEGLTDGVHDVFLSSGNLRRSERVSIVANSTEVLNDTLQQMATLNLTVNPADSKVYFGDSSQVELHLLGNVFSPGKLVVRTEHEDYATQFDTVQLLPGITTQQSIKLVPSYGQLRIAANQIAQVKVDGNALGATPLKASHLSAGVHKLRVEAAGFDVIEDSVNINLGQNPDMYYTLKPSQIWTDSVARAEHGPLHRVPRFAYAAVMVAGAVFALDESWSSAADSRRAIGGGVAALGALGLGLSFAF